jgi:Zn-dependent protease
MSVDSVLAVFHLAVAFVIGIVVHEYAHAFAANRVGDMTPKLHGRLTLNPKPHVEPFGTVILPGILLLVVLFGGRPFVFGYGKPQELNPWSMRRPDQHVTLIALAGPAANVLLALLFGGLYRVLGEAGELGTFLAYAVLANAILAAMNLMPIPPLDASRIVARYLPPRAREVMTNLEQYGALFMLLIFFVFAGPIFTFVEAIANGICRVAAGGPCFL